MIASGALDQRIRLQSLSGGVDEIGQPLPDNWVDVAEVWAQVAPLVGREFIAASSVQSEVTARIRLRYRPGITSAMRVLHGPDVYGITATIHVKSAKRELQLMCKAVT